MTGHYLETRGKANKEEDDCKFWRMEDTEEFERLDHPVIVYTGAAEYSNNTVSGLYNTTHRCGDTARLRDGPAAKIR